MSFFKKIKDLFDNPDKAPTHGDWFYHTKLVSKKLIIFYRKIIAANNNSTVFKTGLTIDLPELNWNISIEQLRNSWGKARCTFNNNSVENNIQVFFFRRNFVYENSLIQVQFYNQQLFYLGIEVGRGLMSEETKLKMLSTLLPNIITENFKSVKSIPVFTDAANNYLFVEDDINLNVCFMSNAFANEHLNILEDALKRKSTELNEDF